ncbi:LytTR family DNA-binding domain-containing protein [Allomuricauda sp. SCSIO 65647]|uniref:LytTR family DNA-binding domain-containing protein n=1 Tax=Allomuricauda sp. SCSIO 65647 TaxID=2908843 RepID=UPI001F221EBD|nr:LytTR family DNA-binding domain-containing protein [Muricauda sp. SCSIO 65647]UJH66600.1 LytTR family transcriptional regulator DNA-binding domain-containing protein [Muricauda sp. SCSIO 65647]
MPNKYLGKYNDFVLFLILIPIINTINYHLTYATIRWDWYTYTTYTIDTLTGFVAWYLIRLVIIYMDKRIPYEKALVKRILWQVVVTNIVAQGFIIIETEVINGLFGDGPLPTKFYTYNLFIFFIWILVINGIYIGFYFHNEWKTAQKLREKELKLRSTGFEVLLGNTTKNIAFEDISTFYVEDKTTYLQTKNGKNFVIDGSLNRILPHLPKESFFRLNRKYIVRRENIKGYRKEVNGKLEVEFDIGSKLEKSTVSRTIAPDFKKWFAKTVQQV